MNRFFISQALLLIFTALVHGQGLVARSEKVSSGAHEYRNLPYVDGGHERQRLDLYLPSDSASLHPALVWIHGGGWQAGSKDYCPGKPLTARGYVVASVGYRLSQHAIFPAQIEDCKAAIRWLRAHSREYGIDPDRIGAWGESAGGHLVALLGTTGDIRDFDVGQNLDQSSRVKCAVDWYGPVDFLHYGDPEHPRPEDPNGPFSKLIGGSPREKMDLVKRCSPIYYVTPSAAPFLIMQGGKDTLVPAQQSELLNAALQKAGVESVLKILPDAGHGGPSFGFPENVKLLTDFLDAHLQKTNEAAGN